MRPRPDIAFTRLTGIDPDAIIAHMSDPRLAEHMPLLAGPWDTAMCAAFIAAKEACWTRDGLGHWAILADGDYAGWGGFQKEGEDWDYGLVLKPACFGLGTAITRKALDFARADARIPWITFLLPPSRRHVRGLKRLGAEMVGEVAYEGERFRKYRLQTR